MEEWVTGQDGVKNIRQEETLPPISADLQDGEVLVKISHVSLNYRDIEGMFVHLDNLAQH